MLALTLRRHKPTGAHPLDGLYCTLGSDVENGASVFAECRVHYLLELVLHCGGNECLYSSGKSAAVYSPCSALAVKNVRAKCECQRKSLLLYVLYGVNVLELLEGGVSRSKYSAKEGFDVSRLERCLLCGNSFVFLDEVETSHYGAVAYLFTKFGKLCKNLVVGYTAEYLFAEVGCEILHIRGYGGVVVVKVCVVSAGVYDAEAVACVGKAEVKLFDNGSGGVGKVDSRASEKTLPTNSVTPM